MLVATSPVPVEACWTLRAISWVAAPCSSTAEAMVVEMPLISSIVFWIELIASTVPLVAPWIWLIRWPISSVAFAVWLARPFGDLGRVPHQPKVRAATSPARAATNQKKTPVRRRGGQRTGGGVAMEKTTPRGRLEGTTRRSPSA